MTSTTNSTKTPSKPSASTAASTAGSAAGDDPAKALEKLQTKTKAVNANNVSRVANSQLTSNDAKLQPLISLKTGKPLEKFPATSKDIEKLSLAQIDLMLNNLEADRTGGEAQKRERLRMQIGLKANPA